MNCVVVIIVAALAYCVGAIPVGYIIARIKGIEDIRKHGSGNIGATNVSRVLGMPYFFLIFFLDAGKAFLFIYAMQHYFPYENLYFFAVMLLVGNGYSPFLGGSGGKGVATLVGLFAALNGYVVLFIIAVWLFFLLLTHTVGVSSVASAGGALIYSFWCHDSLLIAFSGFAALWIIWTHRSNIVAYWEKHCIKS